jgi:zona occludens toxin
MDDFIPACQAGRVVITNVRGLDNRERIEDALGDLPDSFQLVHLPTTEHVDAEANLKRLATFWHWAPHGAFLILDEAQRIWPKEWKGKDLDALAFPGGLEAANQENRPFSFQDAFDMHRHYGWDLVLTTPKISKIHDWIRGASEGAYKHKNQALIGIKGRYLEAFHLAEDNGTNAGDFISVRMRKIRKEVWQLYDSTATGTISDTQAGLSLLKNPRVVLLLAILLGILGHLATRETPAVLGGSSSVSPSSSAPSGTQPGSAVASTSPPPAGAVPAPHRLGPVEVRSDDPLTGYALRVVGNYAFSDSSAVLVEAETDTERVVYYDRDLRTLGYHVRIVRDCLVKLTYQGQSRFITCHRPKVNAKPPALTP